GHAPAAIPSGPDDGSGALPNRPAPLPITSANNVAVVPSNGVWARNPAPLPTATNRRQAEVKPNREWNNATPCLTPSSSSTPGLAPWATQTSASSATARTLATTSTTRFAG